MRFLFKIQCSLIPSGSQIKSGQISKETFVKDILVGEIGAVIGGRIDPSDPKNRSADDITIFESLGIALQDLTAARAILDGGVGSEKKN